MRVGRVMITFSHSVFGITIMRLVVGVGLLLGDGFGESWGDGGGWGRSGSRDLIVGTDAGAGSAAKGRMIIHP